MDGGRLMILAKRCVAQFACLATVLFGPTGARFEAPAASGAVPVLLELFTSEGCSSCPPADQLLEEIDRKQPVQGADLIVLSEHVDYWNHLGWADPYSSRVFTERQQAYASRFQTEEIYTPELVVDGIRPLVGGNWPKAENAIKEALRRSKLPVNVTAKRNEHTLQIHVEVVPNSIKNLAVVYLALAYDHAQSQVGKGENAGRNLSHVAVVFSMREIGKVKSDSTFERDLSIPLPRNSVTRVIAFVQRSGTAEIIGVARTQV
jgi:hypothetical protein